MSEDLKSTLQFKWYPGHWSCLEIDTFVLQRYIFQSKRKTLTTYVLFQNSGCPQVMKSAAWEELKLLNSSQLPPSGFHHNYNSVKPSTLLIGICEMGHLLSLILPEWQGPTASQKTETGEAACDKPDLREAEPPWPVTGSTKACNKNTMKIQIKPSRSPLKFKTCQNSKLASHSADYKPTHPSAVSTTREKTKDIKNLAILCVKKCSFTPFH